MQQTSTNEAGPDDTGVDHTKIEPSSTHNRRRWRLSRRGFLIGVGAAGAGLALGIPLGLPVIRLRMAESFDGGGGPPVDISAEPWTWFEIRPDNRIRLYIAKVEMGQGVHTAIAQVAAEELGIPFAALDVAQATTAVGPVDSFGTTGSMSVASIYQPLRTVAATLRTMLLEAGARRLNRPVSEVTLTAAGVGSESGEALITFSELVAGETEWEIPADEPALKAEQAFEVIGQPIPRVDIPAKVTGQAEYGYDVRLEGMHYGAVLRPPTVSATLTAVRPGSANDVAGVKMVVIEDDFAGVVADARLAARAAVTRLDVQWEQGRLWQQSDVDEMITVGGPGGVVIQKEGRIGGLHSDPARVSYDYRTPIAVQSPLEAQAAVADVSDEAIRIWVSTQMQSRVSAVVADALGTDEDLVEIIPTYLGGGFGRKSGFDVAVEAARLSRAAGVPVHVGWDRTEELQQGYFRPPTHHRLTARLDADGQIADFDHQQASGNVAANFLPDFLMTLMGSDFGATRGARTPYAIPNVRTTAWRRELPIPTGWWRGLGLLANTFAIESFMDELAHLAGIDPLEFRLRHLPATVLGQRARKVLETAASASGWDSAPAHDRGRGVALCIDGQTVVAEVAEISVQRASGTLRVHNVTAVMDCGLVVNPDGARAQVEGNVMWGVGSALIEQVHLRDGQVAITNFNNYPLLTMSAAPTVQTILLDSKERRPYGVGEPPIGPVAAAIANALFQLTGVRVRELPMHPERLRTLLA